MKGEQCISCPKIGASCDGPPFYEMSAAELLAWCKERKAWLHLTNGKLAEISNVPKGTIDRLFAGEHADCRYETIRLIAKALVGGEWSKNPCPTPHGGDNAQEQAQHEAEIRWRDDMIAILQKDNAGLQTLVANTNKRHTESQQFMRGQIKAKNRVILTLSILLAVCLGIIIAALIVDKLNPEMGFFWLRSMLGGQTGFIPFST